MRIIILIVCCIVGFRHSSVAQEPNTQYRSLECVEIVDRQIESVLDSVLAQEPDYPHRGKAAYEIGIMEDDVLLIRAIGKTYFSEYFKGVLQYKGHDFLIVLDDWKFLDSRLFARTGRKVEYPFWDRACYENEQGKIVIVMTLDDTPIYLYAYKDNKFESIPFDDGSLVNPNSINR